MTNQVICDIIVAKGELAMMYMFDAPSDIAIKLAQKLKSIRKRRKITQKQLAARSNVSYATLRKFEKTGKISLESFIKLSMELGLTGELNNLFSTPVYNSIEEVINEQKKNA
ncbi:MAG: helix-turn-helix domain-containing protein [Lachnospiraceae bacterium]|nr:helix-turn-helix domain-containing protein [Lachnospiraceae bacterium]